MIGARENFTAPDGASVQALCVEVRASMPVYDVEVVSDGEVVEYFPVVVGFYALEALATRKKWRRPCRVSV